MGKVRFSHFSLRLRKVRESAQKGTRAQEKTPVKPFPEANPAILATLPQTTQAQ